MLIIECITMAHKYCTTRWGREAAKIPATYRLTFGQYKMLSLIAAGCDQMSQIIYADARPPAVEDKLWIADRSVTSSRVDDLIKRGLIKRAARPNDKRGYVLSVTEAGEKALAYAKPIDAKVEGFIRKQMEGGVNVTLDSLRILAIANVGTLRAKGIE